LVALYAQCESADLVSGFRPPAVPLLINDPYLSIWSMANNLTDENTKQWTGAQRSFFGAVRIDGSVYRFMGGSDGVISTPMQQISVQVLPTRTIYNFAANGINLNVEFMSPLLPDDYEILSRPVSYITFSAKSTDGKSHSVQIYYDNSAEICVNTNDQQVYWERIQHSNLNSMKVGTTTQNILHQGGDFIGIDWGYFYATAKHDNSLSSSIAFASQARGQFAKSGKLSLADNQDTPKFANESLSFAFAWDLGSVSSTPKSTFVTLAYDDIYSIKWFGELLRPYWRRHDDMTAEKLISAAVKEYEAIVSRCKKFDADVIKELDRLENNPQYTTLASLAYRQTIGACKLVWNKKEEKVWHFMKEISSDGDLSTVDVIYPASPFFLYFRPELLQLQLLPLFAYANNETYSHYGFPWAPHHLGFYPVGDIVDSQQENMPIEESSNLLMLTLAAARATGDASFFYPKYWPLLTQWANYLVENLPDPFDQLCTDDFLGPIPHDTNLALKGIIGIKAYASLLDLVNLPGSAQYTQTAQNYVQYWLNNAFDKDHYRLRYDKSGTWSQKYNVLLDYILGTNTFPESMIKTELAYYMTQLDTFGFPLDSTKAWTKLDWQMWLAAVAKKVGMKDTYDKTVNAVYQFAARTPTRVPLSDWYWTADGKQSGFQARPVVGGIYSSALLTKMAQKLDTDKI
jgi:hypothetical protein